MKESENIASFDLLLRTGVLCVRTQLLDEAQCIVGGLRRYRPNRINIKVAQALLNFTAHRHFDAIALLEEDVLRERPDFAPALGLLAMTLRAVNRPGWQDLLKTIIENESDPELVGMARELLAEPGSQDSSGITSTGFDEFSFQSRC